MSQPGTGDKTEKASAYKLRKARERGQVARSKDIGAAIGMFAALKLTILLSAGWLADFRRIFALSIAHYAGDGLDGIRNAEGMLFPGVLWIVAKMVLPLLAVPACAIACTPASLTCSRWSHDSAPKPAASAAPP